MYAYYKLIDGIDVEVRAALKSTTNRGLDTPDLDDSSTYTWIRFERY